MIRHTEDQSFDFDGVSPTTRSHLRDRLMLATVRCSRVGRRLPGERDCYARFRREDKQLEHG